MVAIRRVEPEPGTSHSLAIDYYPSGRLCLMDAVALRRPVP